MVDLTPESIQELGRGNKGRDPGKQMTDKNSR